jgi:hypothetical protein
MMIADGNTFNKERLIKGSVDNFYATMQAVMRMQKERTKQMEEARKKKR